MYLYSNVGMPVGPKELEIIEKGDYEINRI